MLNSVIQCFRRGVSGLRGCLHGEFRTTILFFAISISSCFLLLFFMVGAVWSSIYLCIAVFLASLYIHWLRRSARISRMISITLPFIVEQDEEEAGLDASAIASLPSFKYERYCKDSSNGVDGNGWLQCVICIGTVQIGEMVRNLPACKHLFHVECVDMWLSSHSTCPMCRTIVAPADETSQSPV